MTRICKGSVDSEFECADRTRSSRVCALLLRETQDHTEQCAYVLEVHWCAWEQVIA